MSCKGLKLTAITCKIPATKRTLERLLFRVKALLHTSSSGCTFWMGKLTYTIFPIDCVCTCPFTLQRLGSTLCTGMDVLFVVITPGIFVLAGNLKHKDLAGQVVSSQAYLDDQDEKLEDDAGVDNDTEPVGVASDGGGGK